MVGSSKKTRLWMSEFRAGRVANPLEASLPLGAVLIDSICSTQRAFIILGLEFCNHGFCPSSIVFDSMTVLEIDPLYLLVQLCSQNDHAYGLLANYPEKYPSEGQVWRRRNSRSSKLSAVLRKDLCLDQKRRPCQALPRILISAVGRVFEQGNWRTYRPIMRNWQSPPGSQLPVSP